MKTLLKNSLALTTILISSTIFISCNHKKVKQESSEVIVTSKNEINFDIVQEKETRKPIVFITGFDKGKETYYQNARSFFKDEQFEIVEDQYSLEEIINWLNKNDNDKVYGEIHIVNKSDSYKGLSLETLINGEKVTTETLRKNITKGTLPILNESVNSNSKIIIHANGLGKNISLMKTFKDAFCAEEVPNVIASPYYSIFDGKFSKHYLAEAYYIFYPTANSPGKTDLSKEISKKYPEEKNIDWYDALNNEEERYIGEAYSKQITIPVKFKLDYHNSDDEMPTFTMQEEVMDFIEQQEYLNEDMKKLNIPLEKFRWSWSVKNSALIIKGKTTGIYVLKPLIKPYGELKHIKPDTNNKRLYALN